MPAWAWVLVGIVAGWLLVQLAGLALVLYGLMRELTRR